MDAINIYRLLPAESLAGRSDEIAQLLSKASGGHSGRTDFRVSPVSGAIWYLDADRIGKGAGGAIPKDAQAAEVAARASLERIARAIDALNHRQRGVRQLPLFIPEDLRVLDVVAVVPPGKTGADH